MGMSSREGAGLGTSLAGLVEIGRNGSLLRRKVTGEARRSTGSDAFSLTPALLYLNFRLTLSVVMDMERWDCPAACRRQDSGAPELVALWHWFVAKSVGSLSRACLCPKLEQLMERPGKASSYVQ